MTERDVVAVQFDLSAVVKFLVISVYLPSQRNGVDITPQMELLQDLLDRHTNKSIVIVGDLNAKSSVWRNSFHKSDIRANLVPEFCDQNDLEVLNDPTSETMFSGSQGES